jgi:hypothetical protein
VVGILDFRFGESRAIDDAPVDRLEAFIDDFRQSPIILVVNVDRLVARKYMANKITILNGPNLNLLGTREPDRWQGRHHYLYDDEYQPGSATVGSAPSGARACSNEPVRLRRSEVIVH